ncbi:uncharacterized protein LOC126819304 [Patella vulgata]|uniref:uncharacterized protein LOC126819304 n=1 Tax=Patella vulgata TaxID=6465 RepID=UPI0024A86F8A|nr:uncharacterized protein LOC126819304 [Patella vulgata]
MHVKDVDCVRQLVNAGADVNDQNERGQTSLIYGCILNKLEMISVLLQQNDLDVNKIDVDGNTALMYACALGHTQAVTRLLDSHSLGEHSLDLNIKNNDNMTAADHATDRGHMDIIKLLSDAAPNKGEICPDVKENNWIEMKPISDHSPTGKTRQARRDKMQKTIDKVRRHSFVNSPEMKLNLAPRPLEPTITVTAPGEESHTLVSFDDETSPKTRQKRLPTSPTSLKKTPVWEMEDNSSDLDYDDFSLESLGDLVKTVRQCAQEIREIYAPLKTPIHLMPPKNERRRKEKKGKEGAKLKAKNTVVKTDSILLDIPPDTPRARPQTLSDEERNLGDLDVLSQTWPRHKEDRVNQRPELLVKRSVSMSPSQYSAKPRPRPPVVIEEKRLFGRMIDRFTNRKNQKQSATINIDQPGTSGLQDAKLQISSIDQNLNKLPLIQGGGRRQSKDGHDNPGYAVEVIQPKTESLERY